MNYKLIALSLIILSGASSCQKEATVIIKNSIGQSTITEVNFGNYSISEELQPGDSVIKVIRERKKDFPITGQVFFQLVSGGRFANLKTQQNYSVEEEDEIKITLTDNTEVRNR